MSKKISEQSRKGNPFQRGDSWTYIVRVSDKSGKRKQKWVGGFPTEKAAKKALAAAQAKIKLGLYKEPVKQMVAEYLTDWFENTHKPLLKPSTVRGYEVNIRKHIIPYIGGKPLDKLKRNDVVGLYNLLLQNGLSPTSVKYVHHVLSKGMKDALASDLISKNPCEFAKLPKQRKYKAQILTSEQAGQLLAAAEQTSIYIEMMFAVCLGLRRGEVLGIQYRDIDFEKGTIHIQRQITVIKSSKEPPYGKTEWGISTLKTTESERLLYMPKPLLEAIRERQRQTKLDKLRNGKSYNDNGFICCDEHGNFRNPHTLYTQYKKLLKQLNLPDIRFHDLRHSYATAMIEQKIPLKAVSHMLGHSSISVTADIYCDVINAHKEGAEAAEKLFFAANC